jgi:hypothetical protein
MQSSKNPSELLLKVVTLPYLLIFFCVALNLQGIIIWAYSERGVLLGHETEEGMVEQS